MTNGGDEPARAVPAPAPDEARLPPDDRGSPETAEDAGSALDVFRNRPFLLLWIAQAATQIGGAFLNHA